METIVRPLRVAIIGSGPAGFYAADHLFKQADGPVEIDMFDRLPTPFGLVRGGVAPDHQKIKNVTRVFDRIARHDAFCFFGGVDIGRDLSVLELESYYHAVIYATGAQTDRSLGIPGEDLPGSFSATEFVAWYNGHPDFRDRTFDLSKKEVVIIGVGNVAVDVARILCRTPEELEKTDIADYALEALRSSDVRRVYLLGRRGPGQAAFTNPELRELGDLQTADLIIRKRDLDLDPHTLRHLAEHPDRETSTKLDTLRQIAERPLKNAQRQLHLRFLESPVEILPGPDGCVAAVSTVINRIEPRGDRLSAIPTDEFEEIPAGTVFRSVGYRGIPITGLPFDEQRGVIPNDGGRVVDVDGALRRGHYVAGWIKRGPSGVIGTNKPCSIETVDLLLADVAEGAVENPKSPERAAVRALLDERRPGYYTYADWLCIDAHETRLGQSAGRPRRKLTSESEFRQALADMTETSDS